MKEPTPDMTTPHEPTDSQIKGLLLTAHEMHEVYEQLDREGRHGAAEPLELVINKGEKKFVFLGTRHSNNPERPDLPVLLQRWNEFLLNTEGKDKIVLIEGGVPRDEETQEAAIREASESGLFSFLAKRSNVEVTSPEPNRKEEINVLVEEYGRDETIYYYFIRMVAQWQRTQPAESLYDYMEARSRWLQDLTGWVDYDFSMEHMDTLYFERHGSHLDPAVTIPASDYSPSGNPVSETSSSYRDVHIVGEILRLWDEGKSIFVVYGSGHLIVQERALKELLE